MKYPAPFEETLPPPRALEETLSASLFEQKKKTSMAPMPSDSPEMITVSLISKETGLQVIWVLNREFDWKGVVK